MLHLVVLSTLLSLPLPLVSGATQFDADDFARGFGSSAERLVSAIDELEELGLPVRIELKLEGPNGELAANIEVLAAWRNERSLLVADEDGSVSLALDGGRLDTLQLAIPEGLRAEISIPWIDELGFTADCPNATPVLIATGC